MTAKQLRAAITEMGGTPRGTKVTGDDGLRAQYESWLAAETQAPEAEAPPQVEGVEGASSTPDADGIVADEIPTPEAPSVIAEEVVTPVTPAPAEAEEAKKPRIKITRVKIPGSRFVRVIKGMTPDEGGREEAKRRWGSKVEILN